MEYVVGTAAAAQRFESRGAGLASKVGLWGLIGLSITLYVQPQNLLPQLDPLHIGVLTAALMWAGLGTRFILGGNAPTTGGKRGLAFLVFFGIGLASYFWSMDPAVTRGAAVELLKMGVVYVAAVSLLDTPARIRKAAWGIGLAGCVPAYFTITRSLAGTDLVDGFRSAFLGNLADPNRLAMSLVASSMLLLGVRTSLRRLWMQLALLGLVGVQVWGIVVTYSRGGELGLAVGLLAYLALSKGSRVRTLAVVAALVAGLVYLAPQKFWTRTQTIGDYQEDLSAMGRIHAWKTAQNILRDRPVQGVGLSAFMASWHEYAPPEADLSHPLIAHNLFLEIAAELGIFALLAFFILAGSALFGALGAALGRTSVSEEARTATAALCGYLTCHLFAGHIMTFILFLMIGMAAATERAARRERREARPRSPIELRTVPEAA